jgi:cephalosporin-C deacetylase-like acetyl esterase
MGIINYDDGRSVDVLASLPEVGADRIGCLGLSSGGYLEPISPEWSRADEPP